MELIAGIARGVIAACACAGARRSDEQVKEGHEIKRESAPRFALEGWPRKEGFLSEVKAEANCGIRRW